ncbi:RRXRR domain-containing protein, partial [Microcystis sp. LE19-59.1C]
MARVPVISKDGKPLMPTKPSRARRWIKEGKAIGKFNDLGIFYVQ